MKRKTAAYCSYALQGAVVLAHSELRASGRDLLVLFTIRLSPIEVQTV